MPTQGVLDRQRAGHRLLATTRTHAGPLREGLETTFATVLEADEPLPDIPHLLDLLTRLLERHLEDLLEAAETHQAELDDDREPRERRDEAYAALRQQITAIRGAVRVVYGSGEVLQQLALDGSLPQDPHAIHRFATLLVERLRDPGTVPPATDLFADQPFDLLQAAESLEPQIASLGRALDEVSRESRELESTQRLRDQQIEAFDRVIRGVARTVQGWCELAGHLELAATIRFTPPRRRARRREGV